MTKRANKKIQALEHQKELTQETKAMLENRKRQLTKTYKEEMKFLDGLLAKPTLETESEIKNDKETGNRAKK